MTVDQVLKGLKLCGTSGSLSSICPTCPYSGMENCNGRLMKDAACLIMQGELNEETMDLVNEQGELIDELNYWHKLLWRFIHSDKMVEDAFYKFYGIKRVKGE